MRTIATNLATNGFEVLPLAPLTQTALEHTFQAATAFFHSPVQEKELSVLAYECGYRPMGREYSQVASRPDQVESFSVCGRNLNDKALPSDLAQSLCREMLVAYVELQLVAEKLAEALAAEVNPTLTRSYATAFGKWSRLQVNYSRPSELMATWINDEHEDGNFLTLIHAPTPGLELRIDDRFEPVLTASDQILAVTGEIAHLISGGRIPPLFHRVSPDRSKFERVSLMFFGDLDPICCEPWVLNDLNDDVDIGQRVRTSVQRFGLSSFQD